jgi:hypothetical protein
LAEHDLSVCKIVPEFFNASENIQAKKEKGRQKRRIVRPFKTIF